MTPKFICVDAERDLWVNVDHIISVQPGPSDGSKIWVAVAANAAWFLSPLSVHEVLLLCQTEVPA